MGPAASCDRNGKLARPVSLFGGIGHVILLTGSKSETGIGGFPLTYLGDFMRINGVNKSTKSLLEVITLWVWGVGLL